jgi:hypothetical protein
LSKTFTKCDIAESKEYKKEYAEKKKVRACDYAWLHGNIYFLCKQ